MGQCSCLTAQKCCFMPTSPSRASLWQTVLTALSSLEDGIPQTTYLPASLQFRQPTPSLCTSARATPFFIQVFARTSPSQRGFPWHLSRAHPSPDAPHLPSLDCVGVLFTLFPSVPVYFHLLPDVSPRIPTPTG